MPRSGTTERSDPFDPALARYPVREIPLDRVTDLLQITHDPKTVERYREAMRDGARFPPISVVRLPGGWVVADGHKRLAAYATLRPSSITVQVWPLRRLAVDLGRQLARSVARLLRVSSRALWTSDGRTEARTLARDTAVHWRRIGRSLWARISGRP